MQQTIEQKQTFLRQQIIEGGFNPDDFIEYMKSKKSGDSITIQQWSLSQLKELIKSYKQHCAKNATSKIEQTAQIIIPSRQLTKSIIHESNQKTKVNYQRDNLWDYQILSKQNCKKIQRRVQEKIKPQISNKHWEVKKTQGVIFGFFGKYQLWIQIVTNFTQYSVIRKSQDFDWLRQALCRRNVGSYVPPLDQVPFQPHDQQLIYNRVKSIMAFMNSLTHYDYLLNSKVLCYFLNMKQYKQFGDYRKRQEGLPTNKSLSNAQTIDGTFTAEISNRTQKLLKYGHFLANESQTIYREIQQNINYVLGDLQSLSKHTLILGNSFAKLSDSFKKFNEKVKPEKQNQMANITVYLNNLLNNFNNDTRQHIQLLKDVQGDFAKTIKQQWTQFVIYDKKRINQMDEYLNFKLNLFKKKQKYFNDPTKWQITQGQLAKLSKINRANLPKQQVYEMMFPADNEVEQQKKVWQAFLNFKYQKSLNLLIQAQESRYINCFDNYQGKLIEINTKQCSALETFKEMIIQI